MGGARAKYGAADQGGQILIGLTGFEVAECRAGRARRGQPGGLFAPVAAGEARAQTFARPERHSEGAAAGVTWRKSRDG